MNVGVKTSISTNRHIYDQMGSYLPSGNYYFLINSFNNNLVSGNITCRGEFGEFIFESSKVIKMMAIAQARLARRANLKEEGIPTYASPINSPSNAFYNTNNIIQQYDPLSTVNYKNQQLRLPTNISKKKKIVIKEMEKCVICLEFIKHNKKNLTCFHSFHNKCIKKWLKDNINCPVCRKEQPFELIYNIVSTEDETEEVVGTGEVEESEGNVQQENRIIHNSNWYGRGGVPRVLRNNYMVEQNTNTIANLHRQSINNIRERYSFRNNTDRLTTHNYNLRPRSEI